MQEVKLCWFERSTGKRKLNRLTLSRRVDLLEIKIPMRLVSFRSFNSSSRALRAIGGGEKANDILAELKSFEASANKNPMSEHITAGTERWVKEMVIARKLCPFAYKYKKSIHVADTSSVPEAVRYASLHLLHLLAEDQREVSTKLVVFPNKVFAEDSEYFRNAIGGSVQHFLRHVQGFELIMFHPLQNMLYGPANPSPLPETFPGHFSLRSPYPTMHMFKIADVELEVKKWEKLHKTKIEPNFAGRKMLGEIQANNQIRLNQIGYPVLKKQFESFYDLSSDIPICLPSGGGEDKHENKK